MKLHFARLFPLAALLLAAAALALSGCTGDGLPGRAQQEAAVTATPLPTAEPTPEPSATVGGQTVTYADASIMLKSADAATLSELHDALALLPALRTVDLTACEPGNGDMDALLSDYPEVTFRWKPLLCGARFDSTSEEIDLTGTPIASSEEISGAIGYFPQLKKLILSDCGLTNEQLDALNQAYPGTKIVWTVYFKDGKRSLRTDATAYSTKNGSKKDQTPKQERMRLRDSDTEPLKYCTDLVALDLGHNHISDISFLAGMKDLQILILADNKIADISVLTDLKELVYIELFMNRVADVTPLAGLPKLVDLNLCHNYIKDGTPLINCQTLERLWISSCRIPKKQRPAITAGLPNTEIVYELYWSTGLGWREHERYYWMHHFFYPEEPTPSPGPGVITPRPKAGASATPDAPPATPDAMAAITPTPAG